MTDVKAVLRFTLAFGFTVGTLVAIHSDFKTNMSMLGILAVSALITIAVK